MIFGGESREVQIILELFPTEKRRSGSAISAAAVQHLQKLKRTSQRMRETQGHARAFERHLRLPVVKKINCCVSHHSLELVFWGVLHAGVEEQHSIDGGGIQHEHAQGAACAGLEDRSSMLHGLHDDWNYRRSADDSELA
jgi:hypothetical protein